MNKKLYIYFLVYRIENIDDIDIGLTSNSYLLERNVLET